MAENLNSGQRESLNSVNMEASMYYSFFLVLAKSSMLKESTISVPGVNKRQGQN